jgi:VCBS repeat-containing protein
VDVETLTYGISGGTVAAGVSTLVGDYGTLAVNTTTGAYTYTKNAAAIEALDNNGVAETDSDVFTVTVSDGDGPLVTQTYTVNVSGADDAPTLGAVSSGSIAEVDQSSSTTDSGLSGTLAGADVDVETLTYGISGGTVAAGVSTLVGDYGTLTVNTTTGAYLYTKNAAAIEALDNNGVAETDSDVFTVTVSDGDGPLVTQTYTVNVSGADDAPTLGAVSSGSIAEVDQSSSTTDSGLSGTLAGADVDVETLTYGISGGTVAAGVATLVGDYGTLTVNTTTGAYLYTKNAAAIEALDNNGVAETDSDVFTVTVSDGDGPLVTQTYTVNVSGADDAPTLGAVSSGSIAEVDQSSSTTDSGLSGTLAGADVDVGDADLRHQWRHGGRWGGDAGGRLRHAHGEHHDRAYLYTKNAAAIEALDNNGVAETDSDVFTVTVSDGDGPLVTQTYTVNVSGADDAPTFGAVSSGSIAEVDQSSSTTDSGLSGTLAGADVDVETLTYGISGGTVAAGVSTLVGDFGTLAVNTTTGAYTYTKNAAAIEALDATETDSDVFTVTVSDGDGPLVTQTYTVNVSGADDGQPPIANADKVITNTALGTGFLIPGAALLANDTDPNNNTLSIIAVTNPAAGDSGSLSGANVTYTDNAPTDGTFNYTVSNGTTTAQGSVTVDTQASNTFNGTSANEIFIGSSSNNEVYNFDPTAAGGFGNDAIRDAGGGGEEIHILTSSPTDSTTLTALNFERIGNDLLINVNNSQLTVYDQYLSANALDSIQFSNGGTIFGYALSTTKYMLNIDIIGTLDGTSQEDIIAGTSSLTGETINGANKNDLLFGNAGNDTLNGGNGNDLLVGGAGNDILNGSDGSDVLVGGAGIDTFKYNATADSSATLTLSDVISDFGHGTDKIDLSAIDAVNGGADNAFVFGGNNALTLANSVTWSESGGNTILHIDVNSNATADMQIILTGVGLGLTATDFVL